MKKLFLGIDTSNYTTSAALVAEDGEIIANEKSPLPVKDGECGLRQSDAVFAHTKNLPELIRRVDAMRGGAEILAVGVSARPRDAEGSYMPCFLAGVAAATAYSAAAGVPLFEFSHQCGHIMAATVSAGAEALLEREKFAAFHISGGTTDIMLVRPSRDGFDIERIGGTLDLNMGQAIDRVGVALGLPFPCGGELEKLALSYDGKTSVPHISVKGLDCNLSGLQNLALREMHGYGDAARTAKFVFDFCTRTVMTLTENIIEKYGDIPLLYAGGVMSSEIIKSSVIEKYDAHFAPPRFSSDNAAGTALLARRKFYSEDGR